MRNIFKDTTFEFEYIHKIILNYMIKLFLFCIYLCMCSNILIWDCAHVRLALYYIDIYLIQTLWIMRFKKCSILFNNLLFILCTYIDKFASVFIYWCLCIFEIIDIYYFNIYKIFKFNCSFNLLILFDSRFHFFKYMHVEIEFWWFDKHIFMW